MGTSSQTTLKAAPFLRGLGSGGGEGDLCLCSLGELPRSSSRARAAAFLISSSAMRRISGCSLFRALWQSSFSYPSPASARMRALHGFHWAASAAAMPSGAPARSRTTQKSRLPLLAAAISGVQPSGPLTFTAFLPSELSSNQRRRTRFSMRSFLLLISLPRIFITSSSPGVNLGGGSTFLGDACFVLPSILLAWYLANLCRRSSSGDRFWFAVSSSAST
mmetsp:Transcript_90974/g.266385  ORF Transcript_90974/g.266385 Transcript_90974/m.266385 type:complete len:220 (+) Transcript_90974:222-881(+)